MVVFVDHELTETALQHLFLEIEVIAEHRARGRADDDLVRLASA